MRFKASSYPDKHLLVLAISVFSTVYLDELCFVVETGKPFRYIAVHEIARVLGEARSKALPFSHSLTGCDTVSFFGGGGKRAAWNTWNTFDTVTEVFVELSKPIKSVPEESERLVDRFVILLYGRTSSDEDVNKCCRGLFTKGRSIENIPPTKGALMKHIRRAIYQAGHIWGHSLMRCQNLGNWIPYWSSTPEASKFCQERLKCGCKKKCQGNCKCKQANLKCTELCEL